MLQTGQRVDRYLVEGKLGEGGTAVVYRVRHETLGTVHALKTMQLVGRDLRERLLSEGRMQAVLQHPHVVQVTDVLEVGGLPSLLMEFVHGPSLDSWLVRYKPTLEEALAVFRGVCLGVGYAHSRGVIHRDLKPANVLLAVSDERVVPKVADFGIAKDVEKPRSGRGGHTRAGAALGTPGYMAPEQIRDASTVDARADMWSLGCLLYRLVCGVAPFEGDDLLEVFTLVGAGDHVPSRKVRPELPARVHQALERLIVVDPRERVPNCAKLLELLDERHDGRSWLDGSSPGAGVARQIATESLEQLPKLDRGTSRSLGSSLPPVASPFAADASRPSSSSSRSDPSGARNAAAAAATAKPAAGRASTAQPTPPARPALEDSIESVTRSRAPGILLGAGVAGAVVVATVLVLLGVVGMVAIVEVSRTNPVGPGVTPVAVEDGTPPDPVAAAPSSGRSPEPARPSGDEPRPDPRPSHPRGSPDPDPEPSPAPEPAPSTRPAKITFAGADALWLVTPGPDSVEVRNLAAVPPGRYRIVATFPGAAASGAGELKVKGGETIHLACVLEMAQCRPAP